jgi:hypothetical protein
VNWFDVILGAVGGVLVKALVALVLWVVISTVWEAAAVRIRRRRFYGR